MITVRKSAISFRAAVFGASAAVVLSAMPALANDSSAVVAAGGISLVKTDAIRMVSEDLYISENKIRVNYVFRAVDEKEYYINPVKNKKALETIVAFPMPVIPIGYLSDGIDLPENITDPVNFMKFRVWADGKPVKPRVQVRALVNGVDMTHILRKYGIPLSDLANPGAIYDKLEALPPQARAELEHYKLAEWRYMLGPNRKPAPVYHWDLKVIYYWWQKFPKGRDVRIRHEYKPITGFFFYFPDRLSSPTWSWVKKDYCIDQAAADRLPISRNVKQEDNGEETPEWEKDTPDEQDDKQVYNGIQVHYILTTANNWDGAIGRFHMVLDKGDPNNLMSLCWQGLKKVSPTRYEFTAKDFEPENDLKVLIVKGWRLP